MIAQVDRSGEALVEILGKDTPDGQDVEKEVMETKKTFEELKRQLQEVVEKCDEELAQAKVFFDAVAKLGDWVETAEDARVLREPVSRKPESIRKQLNEIEKLQDEIKDKKFTIKNAEDAGQWLIENSAESPEVVREVHDKIASVSTPLEILQARVNEREVKLQSALMETEEFDVILNDFDNSMKEIAGVATKGNVNRSIGF